jgi:hypothetical protein
MKLSYGDFAVLTLTVGAKSTHYYLSRVPSDFGIAYRLEKFGIEGADVYNVLLAADGNHVCECLGHLKHGHKTRCKHVASLLALRAAGRLS